VAAPGVVTTRSYVGYGIFRPRGVYTESFYSPAPVVAPVTRYYTPATSYYAPVTSYYTPVILR
jgi:hypothetical protein